MKTFSLVLILFLTGCAQHHAVASGPYYNPYPQLYYSVPSYQWSIESRFPSYGYREHHYPDPRDHYEHRDRHEHRHHNRHHGHNGHNGHHRDRD